MSEPENLNSNVIDFTKAKDNLKKLEREAKQTEAIKSVVEEEWEGSLLFDIKGGVDRSAGSNVTLILSMHEAWQGAIAFNEFSERIILRRDCPAGKAGEQWSDLHDKRTSDALERSKYNLRPNKGVVFEAVNGVARANVFHPVVDYLKSLVWDEVPRVNKFVAKYLGARPSKGDGGLIRYLSRVSSILFLGPVARAMQPGCMLKTVVILEGRQDLGKSTAIRALCPSAEWFSDSDIHFGVKDAYQELHGKWLIELAEIDKHLSGNTAHAVVKAFVSSRSDYYRAPFERRTMDHPRRSAFVGSTNHPQYMKDETGGSRWLPVKIGDIDVELIERDRDQLWAEAFTRYQAGESWWIEDPETLAFARGEQADRYEEDVWTVRIVGLVKEHTEGNPQHVALMLDCGVQPELPALTTEWILATLGIELKDQARREQMRVSTTMKRLGYESTRLRAEDGQRIRRWVRVPT